MYAAVKTGRKKLGRPACYSLVSGMEVERVQVEVRRKLMDLGI